MRVNGAIVRGLRERAELTQDALAAKAGVARATLQNIEAGRNDHPNRLTRRAIAEALGVTVEEISDQDGVESVVSA